MGFSAGFELDGVKLYGVVGRQTDVFVLLLTFYVFLCEIKEPTGRFSSTLPTAYTVECWVMNHSAVMGLRFVVNVSQ